MTAATGYQYVKTKEIIKPVQRRKAEINKLYEKLIARVMLRTLG